VSKRREKEEVLKEEMEHHEDVADVAEVMLELGPVSDLTGEEKSEESPSQSTKREKSDKLNKSAKKKRKLSKVGLHGGDVFFLRTCGAVYFTMATQLDLCRVVPRAKTAKTTRKYFLQWSVKIVVEAIMMPK